MKTLEVMFRRPYARVKSEERINIPTHDTSSVELQPDGTSQQYAALSKNDSVYQQNASTVAQPVLSTQCAGGWRKNIKILACVMVLAFMVNILCLIIFLRSNRSEEGFYQLYIGSCSLVHRLELGVHLGINILSTLLLAASNYSMQCLTAPSRTDLDKAHDAGKWLDIGIPSMRNLKIMTKLRVALWSLLVVTSIPLHLLYNSAFYSTIQSNEYNTILANDQFLSGNPFNLTDDISVGVDLRPAQQLQEPWVKLSTEDCIGAYNKEFLSDYRNVILITPDTPPPVEWFDGMSLSMINGCASDNQTCGSVLGSLEISWVCSGFEWLRDEMSPIDYKINSVSCPLYTSYLQSFAAKGQYKVLNLTIDNCIAQRSEEECTFNGNALVIAIVAGCNFVKAVVMILTVRALKQQPLLTVGDVISSYLRTPDPNTIGFCLLSLHNVLRTRLWPNQAHSLLASPAHASFKKPSRFRAVGRATLLFVATAVGLVTAAMITLFLEALKRFKDQTFGNLTFNIFSLDGLRVFGLGQPHPTLTFNAWELGIGFIYDPNAQLTVVSLMANLPQLVVSFLYVFINRYLTNIFLADEWNDFSVHRKGLRVSDPEEDTEQRRTYFLQLPFKISLPSMALSSLLHWMLSASLFLYVPRFIQPTGRHSTASEDAAEQAPKSAANGYHGAIPVSNASLGMSPIAMLGALVVFGVIVIGIVSVSFLRLRPGIPVVGSCSAAISAACHRPAWDSQAYKKAVLWGAIAETSMDAFGKLDVVGHCGFTSGEVEPVKEGLSYR